MKKSIGVLFTALVIAFCFSGCSDNKNQVENENVIGEVVQGQEMIDIKTYAENIKKSAQDLSGFVEEALKNNLIDETRVEEYKNMCKRLEEIIDNPESTQETKDELDLIKNNMAVIASQVSAENEVIDEILSEKGNNVEVEQKEDGNPEVKPLNNDMNSLIENFTLLQNEASRAVEKGDIAQDEYVTLIQEGTNLATLKDEMEKLGESDELNKRVQNCKERIYNIAVKMGSSLAENFK